MSRKKRVYWSRTRSAGQAFPFMVATINDDKGSKRVIVPNLDFERVLTGPFIDRIAWKRISAADKAARLELLEKGWCRYSPAEAIWIKGGREALLEQILSEVTQ